MRDLENRKLISSARLVAKATVHCASVISDDDKNSNSDGNEEGTNEAGSCSDAGCLEGNNRRIVNHSARVEGEMYRFWGISKASDEAQRRLNEKKIEGEERLLDADERMREADRTERHRERYEERHERAKEWETRDGMELEKFRMMMDMMTGNRD